MLKAKPKPTPPPASIRFGSPTGPANVQWLKASLLQAGLHLTNAQGETLEVVSQTALEQTATVYNIEVHEHSTYHVGEMGVWVHNAKCCEVGNVWHSTANNKAVESFLSEGINPAYLNPNSRFGKAFYVAEDPLTSISEMNFYGIDPSTGIRFSIEKNSIKTLDFTDPIIAKEWGYSGGEKTIQMKNIAKNAIANGYNAIRFNSERASDGINLAILADYNKILKPKMVTPIPPK
jgi:hypothetical protein